MIVRAAALHQLEKGNAGFLILRELGVAIINGLVWGGIMGIVTWLLYGEAGLGGVMMLAMLLNLLLAALMGVLIPLLMIRNRPRSGGRLERDDYRHYRYRRFFYFSRPGDAVSYSLTRPVYRRSPLRRPWRS